MGNATQISTSVTIISSGLLGWQAISLSNMDTSAATVITAGSKCELAGAFFTFGTDCTPQATTWTAITTAKTAYITLTPSGAAGSQVATAKWSETAPEWSDSKQGYYFTAGSSIRYIGGCYKGGATSYQDKFVLTTERFQRRVIDIGDWNMDNDGTTTVAHGLTLANIRSVAITVRNDADTVHYQFPYVAGGVAMSGSGYIGATDITLSREDAGTFDSVDFNSTSYNRGWIVIIYSGE